MSNMIELMDAPTVSPDLAIIELEQLDAPEFWNTAAGFVSGVGAAISLVGAGVLVLT
ncbi:hypothetical protein [Arthrobacter methylotrophus]|uniref:Class IIb bacteriocin, lactobin A/cerein 7B family n=2 Tax=Arthrobacter methylotrophus TaxID=121291 RepID=A0ABV5UT49_9MICC